MGNPEGIDTRIPRQDGTTGRYWDSRGCSRFSQEPGSISSPGACPDFSQTMYHPVFPIRGHSCPDF